MESHGDDMESHGDGMESSVEIELRGIAPGTNSGGVLDQPLHRIHIECPALAVPESIRVKIDALLVGQAIHIKEIELPAGVKALEDPEAVVVQVKTAAFDNGLLRIELVREIPEAMKPRRIAIGGGASPGQITQMAA